MPLESMWLGTTGCGLPVVLVLWALVILKALRGYLHTRQTRAAAPFVGPVPFVQWNRGRNDHACQGQRTRYGIIICSSLIIPDKKAG